MGLDFLKNKNVGGVKKHLNVLTVNKYESPVMALNLVAHICISSKDLDVSQCFDSYNKLVDEFENKVADYSLHQDNDLLGSCKFLPYDASYNLLSASSSSFRVAVAGGYSAGKSSLLNYLTGIGNMLPTGVEPVSIVNTFINCKKDTGNIIIRGENLKGEFVLLNKEVLACIQHSSKSKTYIASVLNNIIMDVPVNNGALDKVTFIDTPGYNNSSSSSESDRNKAIAALNDCNAVIWCINVDAGTITKDDLAILKNCPDIPKLILFTKMDHKPMDEVKNIVKAAEDICKKEFSEESKPIGVIAISCHEKKYYSPRNTSLEQFIVKMKDQNGASDLGKKYVNTLADKFDIEIQISKNTIDRYEKDRLEIVDKLKKSRDSSRDSNDWYSQLKDDLKDVMINNYEEIKEQLKYVDKFNDDVWEEWNNALNREIEWYDKVGFFSDGSGLWKQREQSLKHQNKLIDANKKAWSNFSGSYNLEYRLGLYNNICNELDSLDGLMDDTDSLEEQKKHIIDNKKKEEQLLKLLNEYKQKVLASFEQAYNDCNNLIKKHMAHLQSIEAPKGTDIFAAISGDSYESFLSCFSDGVDLTKCNSLGFSPLTWTARSGNNEMMKFFINHIDDGVDLSMKDKRGYNALETAAMCHYQDLCELLIKADKSLVAQSSSLVEMAKQNDFVKWVSKF